MVGFAVEDDDGAAVDVEDVEVVGTVVFIAAVVDVVVGVEVCGELGDVVVEELFSFEGFDFSILNGLDDGARLLPLCRNTSICTSTKILTDAFIVAQLFKFNSKLCEVTIKEHHLN